jgi:DNA-binding transcriptional LysR family regulator
LRFPKISLSLFSGNTDDVLEKVRNGHFPFGLVEGHERAVGLCLTEFLKDEIIAVTAPNFKPRKKGLGVLAERPIIWRERGSGTRAIVEKALKLAKVPQRIFSARQRLIELGSTEAIKTLVQAGIGIAFLSRCAVRREIAIQTLRQIPLGRLRIHRGFYWVFPGGGIGGLAEIFVDFARQNQTGQPRPFLIEA